MSSVNQTRARMSNWQCLLVPPGKTSARFYITICVRPLEAIEEHIKHV